MRLQIHVLAGIVLLGCSTPRSENSSASKIDPAKQIPSIAEPRDSTDSLSYVGYIEKFTDNNSFYTDLYFAENFNYDDYEKVKVLGDQVIYKDQEMTRTLIPLGKAKQYFNLSGLSTIKIYNLYNEPVSNGKLSHIEYVEDVIEGGFVAVFTVDDPSILNHKFCIGNSTADPPRLEYSSFDDKNLDKEVIAFLHVDSAYIWNVSHYKLAKAGSIYSTVSADTTAHIIETVNQTSKLLYKSKASETINALTIVSKEINGRPILLMDCALSETDMTWTSVLIFNGTTYEPARAQRVNGL
jgi:hypothetical protein